MQPLMLAPIDRRQQRRHKLRNAVQSVLLLGGMVALYNVWKTIQMSGSETQAGDQPIATTQAAE